VQPFAHHRKGVLINHQSTEHHSLDIRRLRLQMSVRHVYLLRLACTRFRVICFLWHKSILFVFGFAKIRKKNESALEHLVFLYYILNIQFDNAALEELYTTRQLYHKIVFEVYSPSFSNMYRISEERKTLNQQRKQRKLKKSFRCFLVVRFYLIEFLFYLLS